MPFVIRDDKLPIIHVEFPAFFEGEEYAQLFERYVQLSEQHPRVAYLIDMRRFDPLRAPADKRRLAAAIFKANVHRLRAVTVCEARVVGNELTRGIITAFDWLTGTKWPCATFTAVDEAERWIDRRLGSATMPVGAPARMTG
jgi:hypothetical protein